MNERLKAIRNLGQDYFDELLERFCVPVTRYLFYIIYPNKH